MSCGDGTVFVISKWDFLSSEDRLISRKWIWKDSKRAVVLSQISGTLLALALAFRKDISYPEEQVASVSIVEE
jgi:hypothetical protein